MCQPYIERATALSDMFIYMFVDQKNLNHTLVIDSPFQTFEEGLLNLIYRLAQPLLSPQTLYTSSKSKIFLFNAHLVLFVQRMT